MDVVKDGVNIWEIRTGAGRVEVDEELEKRSYDRGTERSPKTRGEVSVETGFFCGRRDPVRHRREWPPVERPVPPPLGVVPGVVPER